MVKTTMPGLQGLAHAFEWIEAMFSIVAGPMVIASGLIAPVMLFTGVDLLHLSWLAVPWALSMAGGLDIWLAVAAVWFVDALGEARWRAAAGWGLLVTTLAVIGFQANWVIMFANARGISNAAALAQIGISDQAWTLERAAMVPVLVIISAVMRRMLAREAANSEAANSPAPVMLQRVEPLHSNVELAPALHVSGEKPDVAYVTEPANRRRVAAMLKADASLTAPKLAERLSVSPATANALILALTTVSL